MSGALIISVAIVLIASVATIAIGTAYQWQVTSRGYALWMRVIGVGAVVGLSGVTAWSRRSEPLLAAAVVLGGVALAVWYVRLHVRLTKRVKGSLDDEAVR